MHHNKTANQARTREALAGELARTFTAESNWLKRMGLNLPLLADGEPRRFILTRDVDPARTPCSIRDVLKATDGYAWLTNRAREAGVRVRMEITPPRGLFERLRPGRTPNKRGISLFVEPLGVRSFVGIPVTVWEPRFKGHPTRPSNWVQQRDPDFFTIRDKIRRR